MRGRGSSEGAKYMVTEDDLTLGGGRTMPYTHYESEMYT